MSTRTQGKTVKSIAALAASSPRAPEEIAAQVRLEYTRYIEKRDALRKVTGRLRRTFLFAQLS